MSYAREMAQMKAKLVEKEAQLLGGFGSPDRLQDGAWNFRPGSPLNISPQNDKAFVHQKQFGFGGDALSGTPFAGIRWATAIARPLCQFQLRSSCGKCGTRFECKRCFQCDLFVDWKRGRHRAGPLPLKWMGCRQSSPDRPG